MLKNKRWSGRKTLIVEARYDMRKEGFKWDVYTTMDCIVSRWKEQGINAHAVKWYLSCSDAALKRACREVRKNG